MISVSCHCGSVTLIVPAAPEAVTDCNCSICRRYGVLWAYYDVGQVKLEPTDVATDSYEWDDRSLAFHRCTHCGCVTHWSPIDREDNLMGVNARLMGPDILAGVRVRHLDGATTEAYLD